MLQTTDFSRSGWLTGIVPGLLVIALAGCGDGDAGPDPEGATPDAISPPVFSAVGGDAFGAPGAQPNAWADFDRDGDLDLFVGFRGGPDRLYRNDSGTLVDVAGEFGLAEPSETRAAAWGDYDGDGDFDLYVGFPSSDDMPDRLYENRGDGEPFVDVAASVGIDVRGTTRQPVWIDFDGDDDLDLFVALRDGPNRMYRNDGATFTEVGAELGIDDPRRTVGVAWFDMDQDGDFDLFVANQNGDDDTFFRNDDGLFVDVAPRLGMNQPGRPEELGSVGAAVGDYDNDGDLDLFVASYGPDVLWENQGDGTFQNAAAGEPFAEDHHSVSAAFADYDNDGWLDLYVTVFVSGEPEAEDLLARGGPGGFTAVTPAAMKARGASHGVAWADFDQDGDVDLALANNAPEVGTHPLYRNELSAQDANRSLQVIILDLAAQWSRVGSELRVYDADGGALLATRIVDVGGGYSSQGAAPIHVGLPVGVERVDVLATVIAGGVRHERWVRDVDPATYRGTTLMIGG